MKNSIPNVLLVDDSSTNNLLLESALKGQNFKISTATTGEEALKVLRKNEIDLVLLDIMMPGLSGYDVLEEMTKDEKLVSIPVIMVTARSQYEEEKRAKELGAADYFEKPLKLDKLILRVKELVKELV
ncbi:MAG: response regulator [Salinivirgaceae bacterium]|jgi:DNA-binding response OmpR family regulator|nr:response regulator [Salinivirgaceae bacterium]